ncbi:MAG: hypothetical protein J6U00_11570 [Ruminococcus sp.]|uniref:DUF5680 domain-containing protein n=1 Tax=Ruminococcus sp. TaxID=41978 RepID=UPI001B274E55|nr:DUF5680 domain-containing protein [Ruminococcus sp.]MBO7474610.1 hypothetical protein [Ruminococcus sp.]
MADKKTVEFLIRAKKATYAGKGAEVEPSRPKSHDLHYMEDDMLYIDSYLGGEHFAGEEVVWADGSPYWSMNYLGRVTGTPFSGDFLKEALLRVPFDRPFRGPEEYTDGDYTYNSKVDGDFEWFTGYENISYKGEKIYECYYHGGTIK